jgi:biopolymer transport protein TolQ
MYFLLSNPIFDAYKGSDFFGKGIFLSLLLLSMITWILFLQKFFLQREIKQRGAQLALIFKKKQHYPLSLEVAGAPHPFAILYRTLKEHTLELLQKNRSVLQKNATPISHSDIAWIEAHLMSAISTETQAMEKNLFVLSTVVSLAPFLGLLGTVWGILLTFAELQQGGAAGNASATIMGGLAMALGTTVMGLLVAIPALIGYNYLKASIAQVATDMEDFSHLLLAAVELQYREVDVQDT